MIIHFWHAIKYMHAIMSVFFKQAKEAKACLRLDFVNVTIVPDKIGNPNGMQISFEQNDQDRIRSLYVFAETGQVLNRYDCGLTI